MLKKKRAVDGVLQEARRVSIALFFKMHYIYLGPKVFFLHQALFWAYGLEANGQRLSV